MPSSPKRIRIQACHGPAAGHPRSADSHNRPLADDEVFRFSFNKLPNDALQQICALASTRSCPAPCQLALTSEECGEAVTEHVRDAPIELQLGMSRPTSAMAAALATPPKTNILQLTPAAATTPPNKKQQEAADLAARIQADCTRLFSLSKWLKRNSNQVGTLTITSHSKYASGLDYWQRGLLATGMAALMQGLAAGRAAQGRLRLTAINLEVLSHSQLEATLDTLSACKQLRRLHLTGPSKLHRSNDATVLVGKSPVGLFGALPAWSAAGGVTGTLKTTPLHLGLSLSGMSALTHLQLCTDWLRAGCFFESGTSAFDGPLDINQLLLKLPVQLKVLNLTGCERVGLSLCSIKHLTQLQSLLLPCHLELAPAPAGSPKVPPLPQLTSLTCGEAMLSTGADLLELPGLQLFSNDNCHSNKHCSSSIAGPALERLRAVKGLRALRLLAVGAVPNAPGLIGGPRLGMLPQIQHLTLVMPTLNTASSTLTYWGYALHGLAGLHSLQVSAKVLLVEFAPKLGVGPWVLRALTSLTRLAVDCKDADTLTRMAVLAAGDVLVLPPHLDALREVPRECALPEHELSVAERVLQVVSGATAGHGSLQQLELSWVAHPVAQVMADAVEQLPGVVVRASEAELDAGV